jgi:aconitate hydratase
MWFKAIWVTPLSPKSLLLKIFSRYFQPQSSESFERIHRSNLTNMGVLPLQFKPGVTPASLKLTGAEEFSLIGVADTLKPRGDVTVVARSADGAAKTFAVTCRIDTPEELVAFRHGGILPYVVRQLVSRSA